MGAVKGLISRWIFNGGLIQYQGSIFKDFNNLLKLQYCKIWLIFLEHCCENVFFWEPFVGWERSQK